MYRLLSHKHNERLQLMIHKQQCWISKKKIFVRCQLLWSIWEVMRKSCRFAVDGGIELNRFLYRFVMLHAGTSRFSPGFIGKYYEFQPGSGEVTNDFRRWKKNELSNSSFVDAITVESVWPIWWWNIDSINHWRGALILSFLWHFSNSYAHHFQPILLSKNS